MPIPVRDFPITSTTLTPHKMASIVVATSEMLASSNAERIIGNAVSRAVALSIDGPLFDDQAASAVRPAGLRHGIAAITASAATSVGEAMRADLAALAGAVAGVGGPVTFVCNSARASTIALWATAPLPYAVLASPGIGAADILAIATDGLVSATDAVPVVDTSKYATLVLDDAPGAVVASAPTSSLYQSDTIGIRCRFEIDWALRDPAALSWTSVTKW